MTQPVLRLRPIVQEEIEQELKISNFKSIIDDYENEHGEIVLCIAIRAADSSIRTAMR